MLRSFKQVSLVSSSSRAPLSLPSPSSLQSRGRYYYYYSTLKLDRIKRREHSFCINHYYRLAFSQVSVLQHQHRHSQQQQQQEHQFQKQQVRFKTFVSKHTSFDLTAKQILETCHKYGILSSSSDSTTATRTTPTHVILRKCPFCSKPTHGKVDNFYKCYIQIGSGAFFCHRCGCGGSWYDFKNSFTKHDTNLSSSNEMIGLPTQQSYTTASGPRANDLSSSRGNGTKGAATISATNDNNLPPPLPMPQPRLQACYSSNLLDYNNSYGGDDNNGNGVDDGEGSSSNGTSCASAGKNAVLEYLQNERGLHASTLRMYGVGRATYNFPDANGNYVPADCVTFPWLMTQQEVKEQENLRATGNNNNAAADNGDDTTTPTSSTFVTRRIKVRALENKGWQRLDPAGGGWGLFGWHTVPADAKEIVITEGEYDAMAVYQATKRPAVSLPNGCRSLPLEILPMLERFDKIYLWMDNDEPGRQGCDKFAKKIGLNRCYIVTPPSLPNNMQSDDDDESTDIMSHHIKDANDILIRHMKHNDKKKNTAVAQDIMEQMISSAKNIQHQNILSFDDLRNDVLHEILYPEQYVGIPIPSLPKFSSIIKGFRRGELTVLTGPTGSGKTTFLGQLSLDLCEQKTNVLWGSFEIKNTRLISKLLQQYSREPLQKLLQDDKKNGKTTTDGNNKYQKLQALADRFNDLPMQFMKFHGGSDIDDVIDAMDYATYVNDAEYIILDNMQFMISRNNQGRSSSSSSFDKFDVQDMAIEKFRKFATERNVHIVLVVHPRKEAECMKLNISSIYGSAKATQEADTVLIIQQQQTDGTGYNNNNNNNSSGNRKYVEVKKNRFDGTLGHSLLFFDRSSGRYTEHPPDHRPLAA